MPLLLFILLIILIAQFGFWDTVAAILGAVGAIVLFGFILVAAIAVAGLIFFQRMGRR